jgi:hypothetical protein
MLLGLEVLLLAAFVLLLVVLIQAKGKIGMLGFAVLFISTVLAEPIIRSQAQSPNLELLLLTALVVVLVYLWCRPRPPAPAPRA